MKKILSVDQIDEFAINFFDNTSEYELYRYYGKAHDKFWESLYRRYSSSFPTKQPVGYNEYEKWNSESDTFESWVGLPICIANSRITEFSEKDIREAKKRVKKDYPKIKPKTFLYFEQEG